MMKSRRGISLIELICAMGISLVVLSVGYKAYFGIMRLSDIETRRESITLTAQNAMNRIKSDIRDASSVSVKGGSLILVNLNRRILYTNLRDNSGIARSFNRGRVIYKGISADFRPSDGNGVDVTILAKTAVHRRLIRVEINNYVSPRN